MPALPLRPAPGVLTNAPPLSSYSKYFWLRGVGPSKSSHQMTEGSALLPPGQIDSTANAEEHLVAIKNKMRATSFINYCGKVCIRVCQRSYRTCTPSPSGGLSGGLTVMV